jgi:hypothetical protein
MGREKKVKVAASKFLLRLMSSLRRDAEKLSVKEGVSLNQFINVAVAEKLAHLQHEERLQRRPKITAPMIAKALGSRDRPTNHPPEAGDRLPKGYKSKRRAP